MKCIIHCTWYKCLHHDHVSVTLQKCPHNICLLYACSVGLMYSMSMNYTHLKPMCSTIVTTKITCTEEIFVLVSVQTLIGFPMCCLVFAMCKGAAAAALVGRKSSLMCQTQQVFYFAISQITKWRTSDTSLLTPFLLSTYLVAFSSSWKERGQRPSHWHHQWRPYQWPEPQETPRRWGQPARTEVS